MSDALTSLGIFLFIVLFAYFIIRTGRKQRASKRNVFKDFANKMGFHYRRKDDGTVQKFAKDFDGIGQFTSSSLGKVLPKDVVSGNINNSPCILFRHSIRFGEGWAREWFIAGLVADNTIASHCSVQFCRRSSDKQTMYLGDTIIKEQKFGPYLIVVRAPSPPATGKLAYDSILKKLSGWASGLSFRPEVQIRGNRLISYSASRNATLNDTGTLEMLLDFSVKVIGIL